jgi:hypothetical protein
MYRNIFCIFMCLISSTTAGAVVVRESFDGDLGLFDLVVGLPGGGADFGYSDTSNAGGNPGELGGIVARNQSMARYVDGDTWTPVGDFVVPQGPGMPGYAANPPIALGGAEAQYVKITIHIPDQLGRI